MMRPFWLAALTAATALTTTACGEDPTSPDGDSQVASVVPLGGASNVDSNSPISIGFTHAMMIDMTNYIVLHAGPVAGPVVVGSWAWNGDGTKATFTPAAPLKSNAQYTVHLGGAMRDSQGHTVGFEEAGRQMGGQAGTAAMMNGGMMGGGMMGGSVWADSTMMGPGWRGTNGSYGMVFSFTTAN